MASRSTRSIIQNLSQEKRQESLLMNFLHVKSSVDAAAKMHEMVHKETRMAHYTEDQVEDTFRKWEESGKKVGLLGVFGVGQAGVRKALVSFSRPSFFIQG